MAIEINLINGIGRMDSLSHDSFLCSIALLKLFSNKDMADITAALYSFFFSKRLGVTGHSFWDYDRIKITLFGIVKMQYMISVVVIPVSLNGQTDFCVESF
ncbi:MAG: hypothetical protein HPY74_06300 [Firmicutes bacterium]|nr:hypothetical protein [Bacillota bacterium]